MKRRQFLASGLTVALLQKATAAKSLLAASGVSRSSLGMCTFSCNLQWQAVRAKQSGTAFTDALSFLEYTRSLGAEGVQTSVRDLDDAAIKSFRSKIEETASYYEGDVRLPNSTAELPEFEREIRQCRDAGATVARCVLLSGRRYETFQSLEQFREFGKHSRLRLALVEPALKKNGIRLAVENHKDLTTEEFLELLREFSSEWIGVNVDTGNNLALLEEPYSTVEALAPLALSVHLKDMALQPDPQGFLLSEVPCGTGFLDMPRIIGTLLKSNPEIRFSLEMATRNPLRVPCLTETYWTTFPNRRATHLESALARVTEHPPKQPPPSITGKDASVQLSEEESNNQTSLDWLRRHIE